MAWSPIRTRTHWIGLRPVCGVCKPATLATLWLHEHRRGAATPLPWPAGASPSSTTLQAVTDVLMQVISFQVVVGPHQGPLGPRQGPPGPRLHAAVP